MTRNKNGTIVQQCGMKYLRECNHVRCVKEAGHDEDHTDARGEWDSDLEIEPTHESE